MTWLGEHNASSSLDERLLPAALLLKAVAVAAVAVPELNGEWRDDAFRPCAGRRPRRRRRHARRGLLTPTIHDAHEMDLAAVMRALRDLVTRARRGRLRPSELGGASLTVTNLGDAGRRVGLRRHRPAAGGARRLRLRSTTSRGWRTGWSSCVRSSTRAWPPTTAPPTAAWAPASWTSSTTPCNTRRISHMTTRPNTEEA